MAGRPHREATDENAKLLEQAHMAHLLRMHLSTHAIEIGRRATRLYHEAGELRRAIASETHPLGFGRHRQQALLEGLDRIVKGLG